MYLHCKTFVEVVIQGGLTVARCVTEPRCKFYDNDVLQLISLRKQYHPKFISPLYRNAALWEEIASKMKNKFTGKQLEDKMDRLSNEYKNFEERRGVTGNNAGEYNYENEMKDLMGDWHNVNPLHVISFGCVSQNKKRDTT